MIFPRGYGSRINICFYIFYLVMISSGVNVNAMKNWYPRGRLYDKKDLSIDVLMHHDLLKWSLAASRFACGFAPRRDG